MPVNNDTEMHTEEMELQVKTSTETESVKKTRERVITVGDAKTTTTIRGVRNRSPDESPGTPGDFHTQGYIIQCIAKIMGPGGFYHVARQVLGRIKVTPNSFADIFKEGNFQRNFNAIQISIGEL